MLYYSFILITFTVSAQCVSEYPENTTLLMIVSHFMNIVYSLAIGPHVRSFSGNFILVFKMSYSVLILFFLSAFLAYVNGVPFIMSFLSCLNPFYVDKLC